MKGLSQIDFTNIEYYWRYNVEVNVKVIEKIDDDEEEKNKNIHSSDLEEHI